MKKLGLFIIVAILASIIGIVNANELKFPTTTFNNLTVLGNIYLSGEILVMADQIINGSIIPTNNSLFDIGSLNYKWKNGYFSNSILIGAGTTAPNNKLEVIGNARISGRLNASVVNTSKLIIGAAFDYPGITNNILIAPSLNGAGITITEADENSKAAVVFNGWNSGGTMSLYSSNVQTFSFSGLGTSSFINNGANLSVGNNNPKALLHLTGGSNDGSPEIRMNSSKGGYVGIETGNILNTDVNINQNGTSRIYINPNGNVGIGTTNPSYRLTVPNGTVSGKTVNISGVVFVDGTNKKRS